MKMNIYVKSILVISCICLVMGLLLAGVYRLTHDRILENEAKKEADALSAMFPATEEMEGLILPEIDKAQVQKVFRSTAGDGYVVTFTTRSGFGNSSFMLGVRADGTVLGLTEISYEDSIHWGDFPAQLVGKDRAGVDLIASASPAKSTRAAAQSAVSGILAWLAENHMTEGGN